MSWWKKLLKKDFPGKEAVEVDTLGWPEIRRSAHQIIWQSPDFPAQLSLNFFPSAPDLPRPLSKVDKLREFYRKRLIKSEGGLIKVDLVDIQGFRAVDTLFKIPMAPEGFIYVASLTLPFADCAYVIKLQAQEWENIGAREAQLETRFDTEKEGRPWSQDPYDPSYRVGKRMTWAEAPRFDLFFPDHPLSQVRTLMERIKHGLRFEESLSRLERLTD